MVLIGIDAPTAGVCQVESNVYCCYTCAEPVGETPPQKVLVMMLMRDSIARYVLGLRPLLLGPSIGWTSSLSTLEFRRDISSLKRHICMHIEALDTDG